MAPVTTLVDSTFSASILGARTDNAGAAVTDTSAEEARLLSQLLTSGYITPAAAFQVTAQTSPNMTVRVGSLTTKADYYVLSGTVAGQGNYVVRLDVASQNVTITAADASQTRTDEIYLVVQDNAYDSSSRVLPRIGYRKGDLGGANPGPDAAWTAYALLARVTVAATVTTITNANISDQRSQAGIASGVVSGSMIAKSLLTTKGDLIVASGSATPVRVGVGSSGQVLTPNSGAAAGVNWADPDWSLLASSTLSSTAASLTMSSIPATFKHLKIIMNGVGDSGFQEIYARINGDSGFHYDTQWLSANGTSVAAGSLLSSNAMQIGIIGGTTPGACEVTVPEYSVAGLTHPFICHTTYLNSGGPSAVWQGASRNWANTSAITSITFLPTAGNFAAGMHISLYGMK